MNWQPIETAPRDGTVCLFSESVESFVTIGMFTEDKFVGVEHGNHMNAGIVMSPDFWMPLPEPPEVKP